MSRIAILVHRADDFFEIGYVLRSLSEIWRATGHEVFMVRSADEFRDADLAILHVDMTIVPTEYLTLAARYPKCLNRFTSDISKRSISRNLVKAGDGYNGPVIVKANLNSGGSQDLKKAERRSSVAAALPFEDYRVFHSITEVPDGLTQNASVIVERFLPEMEGDLFTIRRWYFFGDSSYHQRSFSKEPVITGLNTVRRELLGEVPDDLQQIREEMGFDFGKFDYTIVDGKAKLFDANRTPSTQGVPQHMAEERNKLLVSGIKTYL